MNEKTYGELLFEKYLNSQGDNFEYEPPLPNTKRLVDYVVKHPTHGQILLEVKDIQSPAPSGSFFQFEPYLAIRSHIDAGSKKFKDLPDALCALVLVAAPGSFVDLLSPHVMLGAMYGDFGWSIPFDVELGEADASQIEARFFAGKGRMVRSHSVQNTRIAALISLVDYYTFPKEAVLYLKTDDGRSEAERRADLYEGRTSIGEEKTPCVTVWENSTAKRRLPQDIFRGEMDAWWTCDQEGQARSFVGKKRLALKIDK
ncbi:MAG: hypothetical protein ACLPY1_22350 [Terracidiphilus sp.]